VEITPRSISTYAMNNTTQQLSTVTTSCLCCNKEFSFYPLSRNRKYCSRRCSGVHNANKRPSLSITVNCLICNKEIKTPLKKIKKYCSLECTAKGRIKPGTEERKIQYRLEHKEQHRIYSKEHYLKNKEKRKKQEQERRKDPVHKKRRAEYMANRYKNPVNREKRKAYYKVYNEKNKEHNLKLTRARYYKYIKDPKQRLKFKLRNRLYVALRAKNAEKQLSAMTLIGCSIEYLKKHIESQWLPGMTWENHTTNGWHVDHIMPCNTFDLTNIEEQQKCFHYTNLRPLWGLDNISRPHDGSDL
jgi:endogenous inhibitor of DNA gyrase (YacG/DUF329 family)